MRPGLSATKVFVVVASVGSFTKAAQVLNVTQGAVSQQIAKLEDAIGVKLFSRDAKQLALTQHGNRLFRGVADSLERIEAELDALIPPEGTQVLSIATFASFAGQWLVPRLAEFEQLHPDVQVNVGTQTQLSNYISEGIELGIRFGNGHWPGMHAEPLFKYRVFPVTSQQYAKNLTLPLSPKDIMNLPLYYDIESPTEWSRWFKEAGVTDADVKLARGFSDTLVALSALESGLDGIALVGDHISEGELESGTLVQVSDIHIEPEGAYYLVYPLHLPLSVPGSAFREWIHALASARREKY